MRTDRLPSRSWLAAAWLLVAAFAAFPAFAQRIDDAVIAHYPFEGNLDEAAGIDTRPVVRGSLEYTSGGAIGRALRVSGDDEIDFAGISGTMFASDFTLAWFMNLGADEYYLFGKEATCDTTSDYFTTGISGSRFSAVFASATANATVTATVPRGKWVHVALVRDGATATVYVDGVAGTPRALPALNLQAISAPLGLGTSPCVGRVIGAPGRPVGNIDEFRIYSSALTADKIQALARRPSFTATPTTATVGGKSIVRASHLVVDRTYEVRLVGSGSVTLFKGPATASSMTWTVTVPNVTPGAYKLYLVSTMLRGIENIDRTTAFTVSPALGVTASAGLQAGKRATFTVSNLVPAGSTSVRLLYAGRVIAGPQIVERTTQTFDVVLPTDIPASLPASVALRAEETYGRIVTHLGSRNVSVAAPFTGKFATTQQVVSSLVAPRRTDPVSITGKLALADGATAATTDFTAYWVGDNGDVTPLSVRDLAVDAQGNFRLDTMPPSLGSMTAVRPKSGGRVRLVGSRVNAMGRREWVTEEGPLMNTSLDLDADTDITVHVRRGIGGGQSEPLQGAYVVLSSAAPLGYEFDLPGQDGGSGESVGGGSIYGFGQPSLQYGVATKNGVKAFNQAGAAVNQVNQGLPDFPPPPAPACGEDLFRRFTDADGRAEFPILGGPEEELGTFHQVASAQYEANECGPLGCETMTLSRTYTFYLSVYSMHKGAGRVSSLNNAEIPTRFKIDYDRDEEEFTIRNLQTQAVTTQSVSANLQVEVPQIANSNGFIALSPALMYHEIGNTPINLVSRHDGGFGRWIDFTGTQVTEFVNPSPDKVIQFGHRPDVNGSLVSAKFYLRNLLNGNPYVVGDFQQVNFVDGCNLQDNPANNLTETWRMKLRPEYANSWRFPQGVFFPAGGERKACGFIEVANARYGGVRRDVCFHWQKPPSMLTADDGGNLAVDDSDMLDVKVELSGAGLGSATTTAEAPTEFLDEKMERPGTVDNETNARQSAYASIGPDGPRQQSRRVAGNNPRQFDEGAGGKDQGVDFSNGSALVTLGEDEYQTILDTSIPLFQWYWGVPEILSAEVYAKLRLLAQYYFYGTITRTNGVEKLDMMTNAVFSAAIMIGVDIDVLFGFIVDAGASLTGLILSEMPIHKVTGQAAEVEPCFTFQLMFSGYVDPCAFCPTPVIEFGGNPDGIILDKRHPENCVLYSQKMQAGKAADGDVASLALTKADEVQFDFVQAREMRRQPTLGFDNDGNGMYVARGPGNGLVAQEFDGNTLSPGAQLSLAPGVRDPQIAFYDADRAVAVWSESAMSSGIYQTSDYLTIARNQRIAWAEWDGDSWSTKQYLTPAGAGEGQIGLTVCADGQSGCPAGGEVLAVWQRDANANAEDPQYRLWFSQYRPATGFGAVSSMDPTPTAGVQDITPSATYLGGKPVVVWTRQFGGTLNDFDERRLAYRVLPAGTLGVVAAATGVIAPSVIAANTTSIRVAWLKSDATTSTNPKILAGTGAIGTQNALHVTQATCTLTTCNFPAALIPPTRDEQGRRLYGAERPRLIKGERDVFAVMRVFRFENPNVGQQVQTGDAIGTVLTTGDLMLVAPNFGTGIARVTPLTADGFMHMAPVAAYNPVSQTFVTGSSVYAPPFVAPFRAALKASGFKGNTAYSKTVATSGPVELGAMTEAPDFAVESVVAQTTLAPGAAQATRVKIGNRGSSYVVLQDGAVQVQLRWNSPAGPILATSALGSTTAGGERVIDIAWTAPATAFTDEAHTLYVAVDTPDGFDEITDDNNLGTLEFAGLPVPQGVASDTIPGIPHVQLGWEEIADSRVAGYRVYVKLPDGTWDPLGASPVHGFLDGSASFNLPRTYAVSTYSVRGVESAKSGEVTVMPIPLQDAALLGDGFEEKEPQG